MRSESIRIDVDGTRIAGTVAAPATMPGVLFVHGWGGSQERDLERARRIARLGCTCLTFDLRGHGETRAQQASVTREDNLHDVLAAYDALCGQPHVDAHSIAVVGSSYGAYLSALLTAERPVRWLSMRVPALYRDCDWSAPKAGLDRAALEAYRMRHVDHESDRALSAAARFRGDVLLVESANDHLVPHTAVISWIAAFRATRSLTHRIIAGADHALSEAEHRHDYTRLLLGWVSEMVLGAR